jgi:arylsulfatase A-like enzyme
VPFVMRYPPLTDHLKGTITSPFATVMDIMPTMLDLAKITHPAANKVTGKYRDREVFPMRGKSWVNFFTTPPSSEVSETAIHTDDDPATGWELYGRAALRKGDWKIVWMPVDSYGKAQWELFDLSKDPGEVNDLATTMPDKVAELVKDWEVYVRETGVVWGAPFNDDNIADWFHLPEDSLGE